MDVILHVGRLAPNVLEERHLYDILVFLTALMGSPSHVKNPYLRAKLAEVTCPADHRATCHNLCPVEQENPRENSTCIPSGVTYVPFSDDA